MSFELNLSSNNSSDKQKKIDPDVLDSIIDDIDYGHTQQKTEHPSKTTKDILANGYITPTGQKIDLTLRIIDPKKARVSVLNKRNQDNIDSSSLDAQIRAAGTNIVPVLVRPVLDDPTYEWEIIWGSRRRLSCERTNKPLTALCGNMSDKDAIYLATLENAEKEDLTPFEWSEQYQLFIDSPSPIYRSVKDMAMGLGIGRQHTSNIYNLKSVPPELYTRFSDDKISFRKAALLKKLWDGLSGEQRSNYLNDLNVVKTPITIESTIAKLNDLSSSPILAPVVEDFPFGKEGKSVISKQQSSGKWKIEFSVDKKLNPEQMNRLVDLIEKADAS